MSPRSPETPPMKTRSLQALALLAFLMMLISITDDFEPASPKPVFRLDAGDPVMLDQYASSPYVLRLALAKVADGGDNDAILLSAEIGLEEKGEIEAKLGFRTPSEVEIPFEQNQSGPSALRLREGAVVSSRPLPPEFHDLLVDLELHGTWHGVFKGLHLLSIPRLHLSRRVSGTGFSEWLGFNRLGHHAVLLEDAPIARLDVDLGLALFAVITRRGSQVVARPGQREDWRLAFEAARDRSPVLDRRAVQAAVDRLDPHEERRRHPRLESNDFLAYGPLLDLLTASFVLDDPDGIRFVSGRLQSDPELLDRIQAAGLAESARDRSGRFVREVAQRWMGWVSSWMAGQYRDWPGQGASPNGEQMRLLSLTQDAAFADQIVDDLVSRSVGRRLGAWLLATQVFGRTDLVRSRYQLVREKAFSELPLPWSFLAPSLPRLLAWVLLFPLLALLVVLLRPIPKLPRLRVTRVLILVLALGSFVTIGSLPFKVLILPIWWLLAVRWMWEPAPHGRLQRGLIWLALALISIDAMIAIHWFPEWPMLKDAAASGLIFCWILVALCIRRDGRWRQPWLLTTFLWLLLALQGTLLLASLRVPSYETLALARVALVLFVLAMISLFAFGVLGPVRPPARRRVRRRRPVPRPRHRTAPSGS